MSEIERIQNEISTLEQSIKQIKETQIELTHQKADLEFRIDELEKVKAWLTRLLPPEKRIDRLFS